MNVNITIDVSKVTPGLDRISEKLAPERRAGLNGEITAELLVFAREHLKRYAAGHHATANRLGGQPTRNLEDADWTEEHSEEGGTVTVHAAGIGRALGPLTIRPSGRISDVTGKPIENLSIAVNAMSYGRTVSELVHAGHKIVHPKGAHYLIEPEEGRSNLLYVLCRQAVVPQERGLLPTDEEMQRSCNEAARAFLEA